MYILYALYVQVDGFLIMRNLCLSPGTDKWCVFSPKGTDHLWSPPTLLVSANRGAFSPPQIKGLGRRVRLTTDIILPRLRMSGAQPPPPSHMSSVRAYRLRQFTFLHEGYAPHALRGNSFLFINSLSLSLSLAHSSCLSVHASVRSMRHCCPRLLLSPHYLK
jgi:hypothetical protein